MASKLLFEKKHYSTSFTLIELLVVIAIIGILAGIAIPAFQGATEEAQIAKGLQFSDSLRNSLMINLISEWKFDDYLTNPSSITAKDSWAKYNANTGTLVGFNFTDPKSGWRTGSNCVSGSCLSFDGVDDYVDCGNVSGFNSLTEFTLEAWVNSSIWSKENNVGTIINKGPESSVQHFWFFIHYPSTGYKLTLQMGDANGFYGFYSDSLIWNPNQWYHVAVTFKNDGTNSTAVFYRNGINIKSGSMAKNLNSGTYNVLLGKYSSSHLWTGLFDEVRIYNAALPQAMIQQHYVQGLNNMLANKSISYEEYSQRMSEISSNLAIK